MANAGRLCEVAPERLSSATELVLASFRKAHPMLIRKIFSLSAQVL
jgi:hypothetical protein